MSDNGVLYQETDAYGLIGEVFGGNLPKRRSRHPMARTWQAINAFLVSIWLDTTTEGCMV